MSNVPSKLAALSTLVSKIAAEGAEHDTARTERARLEAETLATVLRMIAPVIAVAGSRPITASTYITGCRTVAESRAPWRGIDILGGGIGPHRERLRTHDAYGAFDGADIFAVLGASGPELREVTYSGSFDDVAGTRCEWSSTERVLTPADVVADHPVESILDHLVDVLRGQLGKRAERADEQRSIAANLRALLADLGAAS